MKKFISFSGGVESTTMCLLYGKGAAAIWCDTGSEHKKMYERVDYCESRFKEIHNGDFELIRLKNQQYSTLEEYATECKFMPSGQARYCTRMFKIEPIDEYLSKQGECELMIGLNADEEGSREGNWGLCENVKYTYPLIEEGMTRADCEMFLKINSLHPELPPYMQRGGCRMCFYKTKKEYKAMYYLNEEEFWEVEAFEKSIQDKRKKFYSIMGNGQSLNQLSAECEMEKAFMKIEDWRELYVPIKQPTSCGAFCLR